MTTRTSVYVGRFLCCVVGVSFASAVPTCSSDNTPWTQAINEIDPAIHMLQAKGYKVMAPSTSDQAINFEPDDIYESLVLAEVAGTVGCLNFAMKGNQTENLTVDENETAPACKVLLYMGGGIVVVLRASTYHLGDTASQQNQSVATQMNKVVVSANCQATMYTGLVYAGDNKTFKAGTHTNVGSTFPFANSVRLKTVPAPTPPPGPLPLTGLFAEFPKCKDVPITVEGYDMYEKYHSEKVMQAMMKDTRKCTMGKLTVGVIRTKGEHVRYFHPSFCKTQTEYGWKPNQFSKDFCIKACLEMKGIGIQLTYFTPALKRLSTCECFFAGPLDREGDGMKGPPCPCGWASSRGSPVKDGWKWEDGGPVKRGEVKTESKFQSIATLSAPIACNGVDPSSYGADWYYPALKGAGPLTGIFAEFPKCKDVDMPIKGWKYSFDRYEKYYSEKVMQAMMKDTRKCTVGKLTVGVIRTKGEHVRYFHPSFCSTQTAYDWKPNQFSKDLCIKACLEMKGIGIQLTYFTKALKRLSTCECFFAGPLHREGDEKKGPPCPCGWEASRGSPVKNGWKWEDGGPVKRGDVVVESKFQSIATLSAPIACNGVDPPSYGVDWYHPAVKAFGSA